MTTLAPAPARSPFLRSLRHSILLDFEPELTLCLRIAVYQAMGYRRAEFSRLLDASPAQLRNAEARVAKAAERLDAGDD